MTTATDDQRAVHDPDRVSELKIDPEEAFLCRVKTRFPKTLDLDDPTETSKQAARIYRRYRVAPDGRLQPRPEVFAQIVAKGGCTILEAFLRAGYTPGTTANYNSAVMARKPEIAARIAQLKTHNWRLKHAGECEIADLIEQIDDDKEPDISAKLLIRQWCVNLDLARKMGDTRAANRALEMLSRLAKYSGHYQKPFAITHDDDQTHSEDDNYEILDEIDQVEDDDDIRGPAPPTAAELAQILLKID